MIPLPIDPVLPELAAALRGHSAAVLRAPTGAGKTTRVPPALLDASFADRGRVVMLEPRRLAARAAARRMTTERGGRVGDTIGYHVRFDRQAGPNTRILVVTPGILLRMLHDDPYLESVGAVVFDEFHERGLESDLALGLARLIQQTVRPELRVVVMSATIDTDKVAAYFGDCPLVISEGRLHPVEIRYEPRTPDQTWPVAVAAAVERLLRQTDGDVLTFLPGMGEIRAAERELRPLADRLGLAVLPLHGDLPAEQQDAALLPLDRRKVVLATNVAETSVTVEGVTGVVDTGLARVLTFDPHVGLDRLEVTPISKASADQRAGRAGRTQPGVCIRLWSEANHRTRPEQTDPEIRRVDLAGAVLHLLALGETGLLRFPWLEPPREATVTRALGLLRRLGAVEGDAVTDLGRVIARLPVHPRLGRMLVEGHRLGQTERTAIAAALLAERDPFARGPNAPPRLGPPHPTVSDVLDRVEALEEFERSGREETPFGPLNRGAAHFIVRAREQLVRTVRQELDAKAPDLSPPPLWGRVREGGNKGHALGPSDPPPQPSPTSGEGEKQARGEGERPPQAGEERFGRALLAAFPDRVARRRNPAGRKGVMVGGRGVKLAPASGVTDSELFLCVDVDDGNTEALVRLASVVQRDWLPTALLASAIEVAFDPDAERITARKRVRYDDLLLEEGPASFPDEDEAVRVLAAAASERLSRVVPSEDSPAGEYLLRVRCLREWMPELNLPAFDDDDLRQMLPWLCPGRRSFDELRKADWIGAIQSRMTYVQRQAVEREAPERIAVPSGSHLAVKYETGRLPVLAVRIQEVFGLSETPRIASGRVAVLLHLLAPNGRPQQVTDDLASFWANTYAVVRKELRARYPKHAWPEDPREAPPERRPKRR
jgi:ATP-dependent helicase HrpB